MFIYKVSGRRVIFFSTDFIYNQLKTISKYLILECSTPILRHVLIFLFSGQIKTDSFYPLYTIVEKIKRDDQMTTSEQKQNLQDDTKALIKGDKSTFRTHEELDVIPGYVYAIVITNMPG